MQYATNPKSGLCTGHMIPTVLDERKVEWGRQRQDDIPQIERQTDQDNGAKREDGDKTELSQDLTVFGQVQALLSHSLQK